MKKLVLSLAIASTLGLSACEDETIQDVEKEVVDNGTAVTATARVKFDPAAGAAGLLAHSTVGLFLNLSLSVLNFQPVLL